VNTLPYLTADLPGVGGTLKTVPADFVVEELPAYEPSGRGEHLFLWIEKEGISADALIEHLAQTLQIPRAAIGVAGLKDRHAITRQCVSVPAHVEDKVASASTEAIRIVWARRHQNKLKTGHLRGNRFSILLRTDPGRLSAAETIVERLRSQGVPNYYGEQRFGLNGETAALGFALLRGETSAKALPAARRKFLLRLALSAAQSELFNMALADRMERGQLQTVHAGDVMRKVTTGGVFVAEEVPIEQARLNAGELQITGPLFGPKMPQPRGAIAEREVALLAAARLSAADFQRYPKLTAGARRPYLIAVPDLTVAADPAGLRFTLTLPPGTYATVAMREVMK
jgi:tRNA pseudouridine13 synthase